MSPAPFTRSLRPPLRRNVFLFVFLAVLAFAASARADEFSFHASGHRIHVSIEKVPSGKHIVNVVPDGVSTAGDWTGDIDLLANGGRVAGTMELTYGNGDTLSVAFDQKWTPKVGTFGGTAGAFTVTGGTGRFRAAGGGGAIIAEYLDKRFVQVLVRLDGVITLP